jgi:hypothetical protein
MRHVKPTVDTIIKIRNVVDQARLIWAVVDHPALVAASALAGLLVTKEQAASSYVSEQTAWMLGRARNNEKVRGKSKREKRNVTEVILTFSAPSPTRQSTNRETVVPSQRDRARLLGIPRSTLQRVDGAMITKRQQLTSGERGIYWALAKTKRGYSTISNELKSMLLDAFTTTPRRCIPKHKRHSSGRECRWGDSVGPENSDDGWSRYYLQQHCT